MIYLKDSKIQVKSSYQVAKVFQDLLLLEAEIDREKEHFYVMHLNAKSQVKMVELVSLGSLTASVVHPRETYRRAVLAGSASIIVAHNHPSGEVDPSTEDTKTTKVLFEAGRVLGIPLFDHLIFANGSFFSFQENSMRKIEEAEAGKERENP
jgi:DNA repair protein RadC